MTLKIALLEDEKAQLELIESWLTNDNYLCSAFTTGQDLLSALTTSTFDLLLIDWELPDINGPDVMKQIRNDLRITTPIIFVTNRDSEEDIVSALSAGADDYMIKPLRRFEFLARIAATTRRIMHDDSNESSDYSPYTFSPKNHQVNIREIVVELSGKEFELAFFLFSNEGLLLSRKTILANVWQMEADINTRTVDTHMSTIRKKLSLQPDNGWRLKSIYGHGYRLERVTT